MASTEQIYQDVKDWKRAVYTALMDANPDAEELLRLARGKKIGDAEAGDFGEFVAKNVLFLLGSQVERHLDFLQFDPLLHILKTFFSRDELDELLQSKENSAKKVKELQEQNTVSKDFDFDLWWNNLPVRGLPWLE
ncbi:MAG: hypothetical protein ABI758_00180 [Candidatus Woesebacteria bacterium]